MNILEVEGLCKTYPAFALRDVSFAVEPGTIMGFIGRNGAGKSTTIKSMLNLVHPDSGRVTMFGQDFYANEPACKQQLGVVLGGVDFYPNKKLRSITNVTRTFYDRWDEDKYRHYLQLFALDETKKVSQLSSGMRVKYMLALALSHDARLLILDEPTSGLDPVSRDELMELFRGVVKSGERSILFSTHITSDLEKCASHITMIKDGQSLCSDTRDGFLGRSPAQRGGGRGGAPPAGHLPLRRRDLIKQQREACGMELLKMTNITKSFSGVEVLSHVDFSVERGEVHALLGENGAGKSTLMNILAGVHQRDEGEIEFDGEQMHDISVKRTEQAGIAFVHQELNLFNDLKVYENIFLRKELLTKLGTLDKRAMLEQTRQLMSDLGVDIDPNGLVDELETSKKQLLEIAKALHANAKLFILDEPTTALNNAEIEHLFSIVRRLKEQGKSFIFISHKMNEIFTIADRYTVLRNGCFIQSGNIADTTPEAVTRLMVGSSYSEASVYQPRQLGDVALKLEHLSGEGFENVDLEVRKGEIIGLTGLKGAGVSEMMQAIFGAIPINSGTVYVNGEPLHHGGIHNAMRHKIGMIPANRKENSVIPDFTLLENNYISEHTLSANHQLIRGRKEVAQYNRMRDMLNIKANSHDDLILSLSGGNQQKVILGRWLTTEADILIMDNPTQGIDVGAKAEIYKLILELAEKGKTILVNTLEIPEIQKIADRCVVFYHGHIQTILPREEITEERVMLYATNVIHATEGEVNV